MIGTRGFSGDHGFVLNADRVRWSGAGGRSGRVAAAAHQEPRESKPGGDRSPDEEKGLGPREPDRLVDEVVHIAVGERVAEAVDLAGRFAHRLETTGDWSFSSSAAASIASGDLAQRVHAARLLALAGLAELVPDVVDEPGRLLLHGVGRGPGGGSEIAAGGGQRVLLSGRGRPVVNGVGGVPRLFGRAGYGFGKPGRAAPAVIPGLKRIRHGSLPRVRVARLNSTRLPVVPAFARIRTPASEACPTASL